MAKTDATSSTENSALDEDRNQRLTINPPKTANVAA